jgi:hypothetical protein
MLDQHVKLFGMCKVRIKVSHCENAFGFEKKKQRCSKQHGFVWWP